ncbi:MAG: AAA family ATPase [Desulfobulbaceae bacterium]|nr:AAA family ATPase [Desulfobulbaceae bacterium]
MIKRTAENRLVDWVKKKDRKPLVLRGARQVGKTTLVRQFAEKMGLELNEINLERYLRLDDLFKSTNTERICKELEAIAGRNIKGESSLLFLDEVQATPHALKALRYFYEEVPSLPIIAAGSLLEFTLADHSFSMPVGRIEYLHLYPLTFSEFLSAVDPYLCSYLGSIEANDIFPETGHIKLLERLREFFFIGGMPEAVKVYQESGSLSEVSAVHRSIVNTYTDDFSKYARQQDLMLLQKVFNYIPRNLGRKVKYSNIDRDHRSSKIKDAIQLLTKARICHQIFHSSCSGLPLHAEIDENTYKLIFLDIGLANHVCGLDWLAISSMIDQALVNEGGLAEQFIGQHLIDSNLGLDPPRLQYWLREKKTTNAEIDYAISHGNWILPVEVKAGKSGTLKSIHHFIHQKNSAIAIRFDLNPPSEQEITCLVTTGGASEPVSFLLISLPLYTVESLSRVIEHRRKTVCKKCGKKMVIRTGPFSTFLGCSAFPQCDNKEKYQEPPEVKVNKDL